MPPHGRSHRRDAGDQAVHVDVQGEAGVGFVAGGGGFDLAHVGGAGQREQPGAFFQRDGDVVRAEVFVLLQPQQQAGVDAAGPGRHHQALERGEAHRGVDAAPVHDGSQRGAGAEMAGDDAQTR